MVEKFEEGKAYKRDDGNRIGTCLKAGDGWGVLFREGDTYPFVSTRPSLYEEVKPVYEAFPVYLNINCSNRIDRKAFVGGMYRSRGAADRMQVSDRIACKRVIFTVTEGEFDD